MKLTLVRHAEVQEEFLGRYNGHNDIGLSKSGILQAKKLCKKLDALHFDAIYCSDLRRAKETIQFYKNHNKVIYTDQLREKSWGKHEGMSFEEIIDQKEIQYIDFLQFIDALDGEPYEEYIQRIEKFFLNFLPSLRKENILIVTHAGVIRVLQSIIHNKSLTEVFGEKMNYGDLVKLTLHTQSISEQKEKALDTRRKFFSVAVATVEVFQRSR